MRIFSIIIPLVIPLVFAKPTERYIVELDDGKIEGILQKTSTGKNFYAFREIPYAKPPIGHLRFTEPVPPEKWEGVRDASKNTKICMQKKPISEDQTPDPRETEDCLYLNVMTPNVANKDTELLPVYVYIYGGMLISGNPTEYNFQDFLDEDIIVATMNFRSGTLGFLSTSDNVIPANLFIKDQIFALKWFNRNIKSFGGDPSKVTIGGHSSGGVSVGHLVLNPALKGLFRSAILQSGSGTNGFYQLNATKAAYQFAETYLDPNIRSKNTKELLKWLRTVPAVELTRADFPQRSLNGTWMPTMESFELNNAAITGSPYYKAKNGISNHVPLLIGTTDEEAIVVNLHEHQVKMDTNLSIIFSPAYNISPENLPKATKELKDIYIQTKMFKENLTGLVHMLSDMYFVNYVATHAHLHSKFANVYYYQFSYKGPLNGYDVWKKSVYSNIPGIGRAEHCAELPFLFNYRIDPTIRPSKDDLLMRKRLVKLWSNFIKNTNPTLEKDSLLDNITWPTVSRADFKYLDISTNLMVKTNLRNFGDWQNRIEKYLGDPRYC